MRHIFVSYVHEDRALVERMVFQLRSAGLEAWIDRDGIPPGVFWKDRIRSSIESGAHFMPCFSRAYHSRVVTYMNDEIEVAIEEWARRPRSEDWILPVSLDGAAVPALSVGGGRTLRDMQVVRLDRDFDDGIAALIGLMLPGAGSFASVRDGAAFRAALANIDARVGDLSQLRADLLRIKATTPLTPITLDALGATVLSIGPDSRDLSEIVSWPELLALPDTMARLASTVDTSLLCSALDGLVARVPTQRAPSPSANALVVMSATPTLFAAGAALVLDRLDARLAAYGRAEAESADDLPIDPWYLLYAFGLVARAYGHRARSTALLDLGEQLLLTVLDADVRMDALLRSAALNHVSLLPPSERVLAGVRRHLGSRVGPDAIVALEQLGARQDDDTLASVLRTRGRWSLYFDFAAGGELARRKVIAPIAELLTKYGLSGEQLAAERLPSEEALLAPIAAALAPEPASRRALVEKLFYSKVDLVLGHATEVLLRHARSMSQT